jgi:hypothetical protein
MDRRIRGSLAQATAPPNGGRPWGRTGGTVQAAQQRATRQTNANPYRTFRKLMGCSKESFGRIPTGTQFLFKR